MFPTNPTLQNWQSLLVGRSSLRWLLNSIIVSGAIAGFSVFTSTLAGYAFGKKRFPGQGVLFWMVLMTMMLPRQISLIPLFIMMRDLRWFDTYQAMIVPYIAYPFGIFLIKQFMQSIPDDLIGAAKIDGASEIQLFWWVILPLTKPAVGAVAIFAFMFGWNDYLWQLVIINKNEMTTLPIGISKLVAGWGSVDIGLGMAGATLAFIPMLLIFLFFQDYFVKGITMGAVKG
jgi:multiple sugar transport system permease protein